MRKKLGLTGGGRRFAIPSWVGADLSLLALLFAAAGTAYAQGATQAALANRAEIGQQIASFEKVRVLVKLREHTLTDVSTASSESKRHVLLAARKQELRKLQNDVISVLGTEDYEKIHLNQSIPVISATVT